MFDTASRRAPQHTTATNREVQPEQVVVDQIMQPFMGNTDWAQLVAERAPVEEPSRGTHAGELAVAAGEPWLAGDAFATSAFLSGLH